MKHTTHYKLRKPEVSDTYDIGDFNANADIIDATFDNHNTRINGNAAEIASIKSEVLPVERGGTGRTSIANVRANLGSTTAGNALAGDIGVTGTLPVANGGTGRTSIANVRASLGSTTAGNALAGDIGVTGTLPVANGGTGRTSIANIRANLGSTTAGNALADDIGVTGTLPAANVADLPISKITNLQTTLDAKAANSVTVTAGSGATTNTPAVTDTVPGFIQRVWDRIRGLRVMIDETWGAINERAANSVSVTAGWGTTTDTPATDGTVPGIFQALWNRIHALRNYVHTEVSQRALDSVILRGNTYFPPQSNITVQQALDRVWENIAGLMGGKADAQFPEVVTLEASGSISTPRLRLMGGDSPNSFTHVLGMSSLRWYTTNFLAQGGVQLNAATIDVSDGFTYDTSTPFVLSIWQEDANGVSRTSLGNTVTVSRNAKSISIARGSLAHSTTVGVLVLFC